MSGSRSKKKGFVPLSSPKLDRFTGRRLTQTSRERDHPSRAGRRRGISLLEVIVSIAILFASVIALAQLASIGSQHAQRSARITTAQILCQNKLNEVVTGVVPLVPVMDAPFFESPDWNYSIQIETIREEPTRQDLASVQVSVYQVDKPGRITGAALQEAPRRKPIYSLVRWLRPIQTRDEVDRENDASLEWESLPRDFADAGAVP